MSLHEQLPVTLASLESNFVAVPAQLGAALRRAMPDGVLALRLGWLGPPPTPQAAPVPCEAFVGWAGRTADTRAVVVPHALAESIGLATAVSACAEAGADMPLIASVTLVRYAPLARRVDVDPVSPEDWEVIESNAQFVETELLGQICVLGRDQVFPLWVRHTQALFRVSAFQVDGMSGRGGDQLQQPQCVRLARDSEVIVAPKLRPKQPPRMRVDARPEGTVVQRPKVLQLRVQDASPPINDPDIVADENVAAIAAATGFQVPSVNGCVVVHSATLAAMNNAACWPQVSAKDCISSESKVEGAIAGGCVITAGKRVILERVDVQTGIRDELPLVVWLEKASPKDMEDGGGGDAVTTSGGGGGGRERDVGSSNGCVPVMVLVDDSVVAPGHVAVSASLRAKCGLGLCSPALLKLAAFVSCGDLALEVGRRGGLDTFATGGGVGNNNNLMLRPRVSHIVPSGTTSGGGGSGGDIGKREQLLHMLLNSTSTTALMTPWLEDLKNRGLAVPVSNGSVLSFAIGTGEHKDGQNIEEGTVVVDFDVVIPAKVLKRGEDAPVETSAASASDEDPPSRPFWLLDGHCDPNLWSIEQLPEAATSRSSLNSIYSNYSTSDSNNTKNETSAVTTQAQDESKSNSKKKKMLLLLEGEADEHYADIPMSALGSVDGVCKSIVARCAPILRRDSALARVAIGTPTPGGVYLVGNKGSGKSTVVGAIARRFRCLPQSLCFSEVVQCKLLKGSKRSAVQSVLESVIRRAILNAPSIIILDDLDALLPAAGSSGGGDGAEDVQTIWLAEWLEETIMSYRDRVEAFELVARQAMLAQQQQQQQQGDTTSPGELLKGAVWNTRAVAWVATGRGKRSVRSSLLRPGLFDTTVELPPLSAHDRSLVLHSALHRKLKDACSAGGEIHADERMLGLDDVAASAEGSEAADLSILVERALHAAALRGLEEQMRENDNNDDNNKDKGGSLTLEAQDLAVALEGFVPASLRGVSLTKSDIEWADVGGLSLVRQVLKDTLELPMQFQALYERAPQRLASGILLYGPPGCGKTLLAGAVAKECGLNFISVKGPEVLNKYIGASEQAVRDLFARGAAAAPCILFFDEFDAVAPRRGNDSSGVTDRVVNQLLTFLDGVESRSGVYVMAATSRPDLVDPALLRPGRLDKQLLCGFPTAPERADILRTVGRKMDLSAAALNELDLMGDLPEAALLTGADLQAIMYSAQLDVVHSGLMETELVGDGDEGVVEKDKNEEGEEDKEEDGGEEKEGNKKSKSRMIEVSHLRKAMEGARPSVSLQERARYMRIYDAFAGGRGANFEAVSGYPDGKQRTALK